jgi:hypothetical protein
MNSKEYIINELKTFIKKFPNARVRYEYDENAAAHVVEVLPSEVYHLDESYISWESEMFDKFTDIYMENIGFISDDAFVGIENAELTLCGESYAPAAAHVREQAASVPFLPPVNTAKKRRKVALA